MSRVICNHGDFARRRRLVWALTAALLGSSALVPAAQAQSAPEGFTAEFLRAAAAEIEQVAMSAADDFGDSSDLYETDAQPELRASSVRRTSARPYLGQRATRVRAEAAALAIGTAKAAPSRRAAEAAGAQAAPPAMRLSFSSGTFSPEPGVDERLQAALDAPRAAGDGFTYAFVLTTEYLSSAMEDEFGAIGVEILGTHDAAIKVKLPLDAQVVQQLTALPYVEWVGYSRPGQKIDRTLDAATTAFAGEVQEFPLVVSLFEDDSNGEFAARMRALGVFVGNYDRDLQAYRAVASPAEIDALAALDFVLFVEVERPMGADHDQSMATMGVDYIRPAVPGTRFGGASTIVGILDTGFMLGSAAAVPHVDLNKYGCGRNFTSDAAGVWNDQNGHGTHVLGTIAGTGPPMRACAASRPRSAAAAPPGSAPPRSGAAPATAPTPGSRVRWTTWPRRPTAAAAGPQVINMSGGASGTGLTGTDSTSRKLDTRSGTTGRRMSSAAGNSGPRQPDTSGAPGVAKNAHHGRQRARQRLPDGRRHQTAAAAAGRPATAG